MTAEDPDPRPEPFRPIPDQAGGTAFGCPLCGCLFEHGGRVCGSCPMSTGCDLVKCPNCGFQFPRSSRLVTWLRGLAARLPTRS